MFWHKEELPLPSPSQGMGRSTVPRIFRRPRFRNRTLTCHRHTLKMQLRKAWEEPEQYN